jgi:predicted nucleotidyltransferase component of viral defense system
MSDTHTIGERIAEKIKAKAKARGLDSAQQLQKYIQERLCVRLWAHEESRTLTLKGGCCYHFAPEFLDLNRTTADIDVHTYERLGHEEVLALFQKAMNIEDEHGVTFQINKTSVLEHEHGEANGLRVHITGTIGKSAISTYADVGIGGLQPVEVRELPVITMVPGQSSAKIRAQPFEYAIAEKLHAIVKHGEKNTRMKDYRDLLTLSRKGFDSEKVRDAIEFTFGALNVEVPEITPAGFTPTFANEKQADWERYLHRNRVTGMPQDFGVVVEELRTYFSDKLARAHATTPWTTPN